MKIIKPKQQKEKRLKSKEPRKTLAHHQMIKHTHFGSSSRRRGKEGKGKKEYLKK